MKRILMSCEAVEKTIAAIYRQLADSVECEEELKSIWRKMAEDEDDHALQIAFAYRLPEKETLRELKVGQAEVDKLLGRAETVLEAARTSVLSVEDALRVSVQLEGKFLAVHTALAVEFVDENMRKMFQSLAECDEEHQRELKEYCARRLERQPSNKAASRS